MPDLLDASVWFPLSVQDHAHHGRAVAYWHTEAAEEQAFCRLTALALLRLLTNPKAAGSGALDGESAWGALKTWLSVPGVKMLGEPAGIDEILATWSLGLSLRGGHWTDAYLAAFAMASGCRMVTFDGDFLRYPGLDCLHLKP